MSKILKLSFLTCLIISAVSISTALDINSSQPLNYFNDGNLEFQVDTTGNVDSYGDLNLNDNDIRGVDQLTIPDNSDSSGKNLLQIGDDAYLTDIDSGNTLGIHGLQDSTVGEIQLGSSGPTITGTSGGDLNMNGNLITNADWSGANDLDSAGNLNSNTVSTTELDTGSVDGRYVNKAGDSMGGNLDMSRNNVNQVGSERTDLGWRYASSTQCDSSTDYALKRIELYDRNGDNGDLKKEFRVYVAADDNHGFTGTYSIFVNQHSGESRFSNIIVTRVSGRPGLLQVQSNGSEVWIRPNKKWGSVYYRTESNSHTGGNVPLNTQCSDPTGMDVKKTGPFDYDWDSSTLREYPRARSNGNLDMNGNNVNSVNTVNSNNVEASNRMVLPTGTDAY